MESHAVQGCTGCFALLTVFFYPLETSEHQNTSSAPQSDKCQQTAETYRFCEAGADGDAGSEGRRA